MKRLALILGLSLLLMPVVALADGTDSFDFSATGGTDSSWSWAGVSSPLTANTGSGITLATKDWEGNTLVTGVQLIVNGTNMTAGYTPVCGDPTFACSFLEGSQLAFTTGNATSWNGGTATFASGGTITVSPDIWGDCPEGYCFTGTFTSAQLLFSAGGNTATFVGTFVAGSLSPTLLGYLGEYGAPINPNDSTDVTGSMTVTFAVPGTISAGCSAAGEGQTPVTCYHSGDLVVEPVPEPGTLTLFGMGLLGLAGALRRKMKKA